MAKTTIEITEQELKDLKMVRNYFGEHDVTILEHFAYSFLDDLHKKLCDGKILNDEKALHIPVVVGRSELLKAFYAYVDDKWALGMLTDKVDEVIEGFEKSL